METNQTNEADFSTKLSVAAQNPNDPSGRVTVLLRTFKSDDPYEIIDSNISFINYLLRGYLKQDEIPYDALKSYYVDYYLAQVNNGGMSQFAYNSRMTPQVRKVVRDGLEAIGADQHLELFGKFEALFDSLSIEQRKTFFESDYFGDNQLRDKLNSLKDDFYTLNEKEDILQLNSKWLKELPNLSTLLAAELVAEAERRFALVSEEEMASRKKGF